MADMELSGAVSAAPDEPAGAVASGSELGPELGPGGVGSSGAASAATPGDVAVSGNFADDPRRGIATSAADQLVPAAAAAVSAPGASNYSAVAASTPAPPAQQTFPEWTDSLEQGRLQIQNFVFKLRRHSGGANVPVLAIRQESVCSFLWFLEFGFGDATPALKRYPNRIHEALELLSKEEHRAYVPPSISRWATTIHAKFERDNWGEHNNNNNTASATAPAPAPLPAAAPAPVPAPGQPVARLPPTNHPIWGTNGIMHGFKLIIHPSRGRTYHLDERYIAHKRNARILGANNLTPGDWWPLQVVALYHGAHGSAIKGISGSAVEGAYSVVVSGKSAAYQALDRDQGELLWYSSDSPRNNDVAAPSPETRALQRSVLTRRPVRVLRSAGLHNRVWAPEVGIRYDGLYRVEQQIQASHGNEGRPFWKFKLRRLPGQRPLTQICAAVPSAQQKLDEGRVRSGY
ncbi:PUA-like domain-containing protein [Chaetomidium leptoderma]|uniref:PUA-like domain-containing protein n=1 Tax=Chaetomidium leptoderma TaxID=669021 RepID=A0AAN6ZV35_9PEZI|nr:PUA-like domain-containing protein [Chaetomidium leptoderma]